MNLSDLCSLYDLCSLLHGFLSCMLVKLTILDHMVVSPYHCLTSSPQMGGWTPSLLVEVMFPTVFTVLTQWLYSNMSLQCVSINACSCHCGDMTDVCTTVVTVAFLTTYIVMYYKQLLPRCSALFQCSSQIPVIIARQW